VNGRFVAIVLSLAFGLAGCGRAAKTPLLVFAGAAIKAPLDEYAASWSKRNGIEVQIAYGGSGAVLSQMILARSGDVYISGSEEFMAKAEERKAVDRSTRRTIATLVPVLAVPRGNPKRILTLEDLARPGLRVGIGDPETVCVGAVALRLFREAGLLERIEPNIVVHAKSCEDTAAVLALGQVDAVIGWDVFDDQRPQDIAVVPLPPALSARTDHVVGAVAAFATHAESARSFLDGLTSPEGRAIVARHGYTVEAP
jgi:molybdate transport system substrate-binding protein